MKNPQEALYNPQVRAEGDLLLHGMGTRSEHPPDHVARTPVFDGHLVMCFRNAFFCTTDSGRVVGGPGDCIIHPPHYPQEHGTPSGSIEGFTNDWISVAWPGLPLLLKEYELPINTIIHTGVASLMEPFLKRIHFEVYDQAPFAQRAICAQLELLLLEIARRRATLASQGKWTRADIEVRNRLLEVRVQVHQRLRKAWTVAEMAEMVNLSPGYFATRYTEFFGISPVNDLVARRIAAAQRWLREGHYEISEIAERAGFTDVYYFSRAFRKRVGCPPGAYRRGLVSQVAPPEG
jgi:AraC-like DNA-binding protein